MSQDKKEEKEMVQTVTDWVTGRLTERTTWDGAALVGVSCVALFWPTVIQYAALAGIVWGAITILKAQD